MKDSYLKDTYQHFKNYEQNKLDAEFFLLYLYHFFIKKEDVVLDVGANHGLHTFPLADLVGPEGKVYAIEPILKLAQNLSLRAEGYPIEIIQAAATSERRYAQNPGMTSFCEVEGFAGAYSGIVQLTNIPEGGVCTEIDVPSTTLDRAIPVDKRVSFIKSDAEGGDFDVLRGAERILSTDKPVCVFEFGRQFSADMYDYSKEDFFAFFEKLDYSVFTFAGGRFTLDMWNRQDLYWEMWAVHNESPLLYFFSDNLPLLSQKYAKRQYASVNNLPQPSFIPPLKTKALSEQEIQAALVHKNALIVPLSTLPGWYLSRAGIVPGGWKALKNLPFIAEQIPYQALLHCLQQNFADYLEGLSYNHERYCWRNEKLDIIYNHDIDCSSDHLEQLRQRLAQRVTNFSTLMCSDNMLLFCFSAYFLSNPSEIVHELYETLHERRAGRPFDLGVLAGGDAPIEQTRTISVLREPYPYATPQDWYKSEYADSETGVKFQNSIAAFYGSCRQHP